MPDTCDFAEAAAFLAHFGPSNCFQTFDDTSHKNPSLVRVLHGTLDIVYPHLVALNKKSAGVFFTVNEVMSEMPRVAKNIARVRAFFADCDDPARRHSVETEIARRGLSPSIVVETSPGKRHYYWLTDDCPLEAFAPTQKAIAAALGTDPVVCDLPRVMRLPGFLHRKGAPFLVRVVV